MEESSMINIVEYLFQTEALKVCLEDNPFWYASGKIGPYYINAHFLYGNEQIATELLKFIDDKKEDQFTLPKKICEETLNQYNRNGIYKMIIDEIINGIEKKFKISDIDYISGGERRDWFFSNIIAYKLQKPHITIFKDLSIVVNDNCFDYCIERKEISNAKILHVSDLITEASSFENKWIPAVRNNGANIIGNFSVIDRNMGGREKLEAKGIKSFAILTVNEMLFNEALNLNIINNKQFELIKKFNQEPIKTMRNFLIEHPDFIEKSLKKDEKTAQKVNLCIQNNYYNL